MSDINDLSLNTTSPISNVFICSSCHHLLVEPKFSTCGHRYCSHCIEKMIESQSSAICSANNCGQMIKNNEIYPDFAVENNLNILTNIVCHNETKGCSWKGNYVSYRDHSKTCKFDTLQCSHCSIYLTNEFTQKEHLSSCPEMLVPCVFKNFGCDTMIRQKLIQNHVQSSLVKHLQLLTDFIPTFIIKNLQDKSSQNKSINEDKNEDLCREQKSLKKDILGHSNLFNEEYNKCMKYFFDKSELLASFIHCHGTYLWCIDEIDRLYREAKGATFKAQLVESSPFYTSTYGYKLGLKLFLNGDLDGFNKFLSLHITVMKGNYDPLLNWPFQYSIIICLYDMSEQHHHVIHTIKPKEYDECFKQPQADTNPYVQITNFCPLELVFGKQYAYVQNDKMFIKIFISFEKYNENVIKQWIEIQSNGYPVNKELEILEALHKQE
ncbi:unnamed protein product [Rotaria magnacalcarata]|uniref:TNF receptor-associated factor n=1 Tax=Rotaria magnacalcarata TaxID=392030 RepID=A0A816ZAR1_9BILA|nr:unnamed protein product [Rotaria magnacalcarata]CAF4036963.1 unnamed protein product [Rotaria magnacalcarata]